MHWNASNGKIYINGNEFGTIQDVTFGGDTFDRSDEVLCSAKGTDTCSFTVANSSCYDGLTNVVNYAAKADVSSLQEQLRLLQERIDALTDKHKAPQGLRSALKTLCYEREVK